MPRPSGSDRGGPGGPPPSRAGTAMRRTVTGRPSTPQCPRNRDPGIRPHCSCGTTPMPRSGRVRQAPGSSPGYARRSRAVTPGQAARARRRRQAGQRWPLRQRQTPGVWQHGRSGIRRPPRFYGQRRWHRISQRRITFCHLPGMNGRRSPAASEQGMRSGHREPRRATPVPPGWPPAPATCCTACSRPTPATAGWPPGSSAAAGAERCSPRRERTARSALFGCRMCGQCALPATGYACPMTCPKQLRNGPVRRGVRRTAAARSTRTCAASG